MFAVRTISGDAALRWSLQEQWLFSGRTSDRWGRRLGWGRVQLLDVVGKGISHSIDDILIALALKASIIDCGEESKYRVDRVLVPIMHFLVSSGLLIELLVVTAELLYDASNHLVLLANRSQFLMQRVELFLR